MPTDHKANMSYEDRRAMEHVAAATRDIRTSPIPLTSDMIRSLQGLIKSLAGRHHLEGAATSNPEAIILFQTSATVPPGFRADEDLRHVFIWGWPGRFGASFTITVEHVSGVRSRAWFPQGSPALDMIRGGKFNAVLVRGSRPIAAYVVDFTSSKIALDFLYKQLDGVRSVRPTFVADIDAHYWEVIDCLKTYSAIS